MKPSLYEGIQTAFVPQQEPWDEYFLNMAKNDFLLGRHEVPAVKSYFVRSTPFGGSFMHLGGITKVLETIETLQLDTAHFLYNLAQRGYPDSFLRCLEKRKRLQLKVHAAEEGSIFLPNEPIISVEGPLLDIRLAEGITIETCNFWTLSTTKWNRLVRTVAPATVADNSRRRAQNPTVSAICAMMAGCSSTSNSEMYRHFKFPLNGTVGHEWYMAYGDVALAMDQWLIANPDKPMALVDTGKAEVDFPIWLEAIWRHREAIMHGNAKIWGWRLDSGDLVQQVLSQHQQLRKHPLFEIPWFRDKLLLIMTNDLDEYTCSAIIEQITKQAAHYGLNPEEIFSHMTWSAGTKPGTCFDQPALGGVMKIQESEGYSGIKLGLNANGEPGEKTSIPGFNRSAMIYSQGELKCTLVYPARLYNLVNGKLKRNGRVVPTLQAWHPNNPGNRMKIKDYVAVPQQKVLYNSLPNDTEVADMSWKTRTVDDIAQAVRHNTSQLPWYNTRIESPHTFNLMVTPEVYNLRSQMIAQGVIRADKLQ